VKKVRSRKQSINRQTTTPLNVPRSLRGQEVRTITSMPAGRMVPVAGIPLLREDRVRAGRVRLSFEMHETAEILMNPVHVGVKAYLVPYLAFDRFDGMDDLNRSYKGVAREEGEDPIPFFETKAFGNGNAIYKHMGLHAKADAKVNTAYLEAYNRIWNYRATNRSPDIEERERLDETLAPAFWRHDRYRHIVPDYDQALIDGEIALNVINSKIPVRGLGLSGQTGGWYDLNNLSVRETGRDHVQYPSSMKIAGHGHDIYIREDADKEGFPDIFAEMAESGISITLSNIEAAKKTAAFARLRQKYEGFDDDYIISMLMDGLTIPEQMYKQPMLISSKRTIFGMSKRYASDGDNLTESVVNGATFMDINLTIPRVPTGGVIMVVAEAVPDQLFERQEDPLLMTTDVEELPQFLRDETDPEKVDVVKNSFVDVDHDNPDDVFGYAPLNYKWDIKAARIGGRFYRPEVDASFDEDRQRFWASEVQNPTLSEDFYLASEIHTKPFADREQDPFEVVALGQIVIEGNTVFGGALQESSHYEEVSKVVPTDYVERRTEPKQGETKGEDITPTRTHTRDQNFYNNAGPGDRP